MLSALSAFFRKELEGASPTHEFKVPTGKKVLKAWLDLAHFRNLPPLMIWSIRASLFKLCEYLVSPSVTERAMFLMHSAIEKNPWEVFCLASQRNNVGLAKSALKNLAIKNDFVTANGVTVSVRIGNITPEQAREVALPYLLGLFSAALSVAAAGKPEENGHPKGHANGYINGYNGIEADDYVDWHAVAERFKPIVG